MHTKEHYAPKPQNSEFTNKFGYPKIDEKIESYKARWNDFLKIKIEEEPAHLLHKFKICIFPSYIFYPEKLRRLRVTILLKRTLRGIRTMNEKIHKH